MQYGKNESAATGMPRKWAILSGLRLAALAARLATYGPRKTVPMVVLKAELAQSYMAQPKISRLSLILGLSVCAIAMDVSFAVIKPCLGK